MPNFGSAGYKTQGVHRRDKLAWVHGYGVFKGCYQCPDRRSTSSSARSPQPCFARHVKSPSHALRRWAYVLAARKKQIGATLNTIPLAESMGCVPVMLGVMAMLLMGINARSEVIRWGLTPLNAPNRIQVFMGNIISVNRARPTAVRVSKPSLRRSRHEW